jgi:hypothetical protein
LIPRYNENKPVPTSKDTQEISPPAGAEMLEVYKKHPYETSILDDFLFYEKKQENIMNKEIVNEEMYMGHMGDANYLGGVILGNENLRDYNTNIGVSNNKMMNERVMMESGGMGSQYPSDMMGGTMGNQVGNYTGNPNNEKVYNPMGKGVQMNMRVDQQPMQKNTFTDYMHKFNNINTPVIKKTIPTGVNIGYVTPNPKKMLKRVNSTDNVTKHHD